MIKVGDRVVLSDLPHEYGEEYFKCYRGHSYVINDADGSGVTVEVEGREHGTRLLKAWLTKVDYEVGDEVIITKFPNGSEEYFEFNLGEICKVKRLHTNVVTISSADGKILNADYDWVELWERHQLDYEFEEGDLARVISTPNGFGDTFYKAKIGEVYEVLEPANVTGHGRVRINTSWRGADKVGTYILPEHLELVEAPQEKVTAELEF